MNLKDRLRMIRSRGPAAPELPPEPPPPAVAPTPASRPVAGRSIEAGPPVVLPPGAIETLAWTPVGPEAWQRQVRWPLDPTAYPGLSPQLWQQVLSRLGKPWLSMDTETTGLSGGAGTHAFLLGLGRVEGGDLVTDQFFMADYPGEAATLEAYQGTLGCWAQDHEDFPGLLTFNGAAFDLPLLRTRAIMNGLFMDEPPHRDLLHPCRRLWKPLLGSGKLSALERGILGFQRVDDVPGSEVPQRWFTSLGSGLGPQHPLLAGVFEHHRHDMASLLVVEALRSVVEEEALAGRRDLVRPWRGSEAPGEGPLPVSARAWARWRAEAVGWPAALEELRAILDGADEAMSRDDEARACWTLVFYQSRGLEGRALRLRAARVLWDAHGMVAAGLYVARHEADASRAAALLDYMLGRPGLPPGQKEAALRLRRRHDA